MSEFTSLPIPAVPVSSVAAALRTDIELLSPAVVGHEEAIVHFYDQLIDAQTAGYPGDGKYIVVGGAGDSMTSGSSAFSPFVTREFLRRFGQGAVASAFLGGSVTVGTGQFSMTTTLAGSAVATSESFIYLPNGDYWTIPAGGSVTETPNSANIHAGFRRVRCWYGIRSGGGSLTFTVTQNGAGLTPKVVNTGVGTPNTIGYVDFDFADGLVVNGKPILQVAASGGTCHYLGSYMYLQSGFVPVSLGRGSSSYAQALTGPAANLATFCSAMDVRLIFHAVKEEDLTYNNLRTMMDRWATQHPRCSHIWVGATPSPSAGGVNDVNSNAAMQAKCLEHKMAYVDGQRLLRSVAYMGTIGPASDGWNESPTAPHLSLPARRFIATWVIDKLLLGLQVAGGRQSNVSEETLRMDMLRDTRVRVGIWAQTSSTYGGSNFTHVTPDFGRMTFRMTASPAPVANSGRGGKVAHLAPNMAQRMMIGYRITDGNLIDGVFASIVFSGGGPQEVGGLVNSSFGGFRIIHGVDTISGQPVPFIQFAVKGSGTSETLSPKIYHSSATGVAPFAGGDWNAGENIYWIEYFGGGTSPTKRFRAWHEPCAAGSSSTRVAARRMIADWSGNITVGGTVDPSVYFGLYTLGSPGTPGGVRDVALSNLWVDHSPPFAADLTQSDMQY